MNRLLVLLVAIGLIAGAVVGSNYLKTKLKPQLPILDTLGGEFSLPSTKGREVQLSEYEGKVVLLNFGFTSCPDVCPTALAKMRVLTDALSKQGANFQNSLQNNPQNNSALENNRIQPLFITIDPERDTIKKLNEYLLYFHPNIIGLRGDQEQLAKVAQLYKAFYQKQEVDSELDYGFIHNDHIYLIDQEGRVRAMYSGSVKPETIIEQIKTLL